MKLVIATQNPGKVKEIKNILSVIDIEIISASEVGITTGAEEDGDTVEVNAQKKAQFISRKANVAAIADDAGLFIDALNGDPGVLSARWSGLNSTDDQKVHKVLDALQNILPERRGAYFKSAVALCYPDNSNYIFIGQCPGVITDAPRGNPREQLPYNLIFQPEGCTQTFAEMTDNEKNLISHRAIAFTKLIQFLKGKIDFKKI